MSQENLSQFVSQISESEDLRTELEGHLDDDGEMSIEELIELGAAYGCEFTAEDLMDTAELSDEELDGVAGGFIVGPVGSGRSGSRVKFDVGPVFRNSSASIEPNPSPAPRFSFRITQK